MDISKLTSEEKIALTTSATSHETVAIEEKGIPEAGLFDGPFGLIKFEPHDDNFVNPAFADAGAPAGSATAFPTGEALASTWNRRLLEQIGSALGRECSSRKVNMLLGPAVNIQRNPLCGRNFEYYSEDPVLAGELAASYINGLQGEGVACCIKHYAMNNTETNRLSISSDVDERTMRDIYLKPFEIAVKKSNPWGLMCSYNKINGIQGSENKYLLTDILRDEWGFDGVVVSDWGAVHHRGRALWAGLDLCFPKRETAADEIHESLKKGLITQKEIDNSARRIVKFIERTTAKEPADVDYFEHYQLAVKAAEEGAVLIKNEGILPITPDKYKKIAVVGSLAEKPLYRGDGSSGVENPARFKTPLDAIKEYCGDDIQLDYLPDESDRGNSLSISGNERLANNLWGYDLVIAFVGQELMANSEAAERNSIMLPPHYNYLCEAIHARTQKIVTVANIGSCVDLSYLEKFSKALFINWLGGEGMGQATANLLFGRANFSGKLPQTFAKKVEDYPAYADYNKTKYYFEHNDKFNVGYRYFDSADCKPLYPFGYGLSYTKYEYSDLSVSEKQPNKWEISFNLKNTGDFDGAEIVQLYTSQAKSFAPQPQKELRNFEKVFLKAGESQKVTFELSAEELGWYNIMIKRRFVEGGEYTVKIGASSADIRLEAKINVTQTEEFTLLEQM